MPSKSHPPVRANPLPGLAIPPGETLADELQSRGITQTAFSKSIGRPLNTVNEIIRGKKAITAETALAFEKELGISAELWLNLESRYQLTLARLRKPSDSRRVSSSDRRKRVAL